MSAFIVPTSAPATWSPAWKTSWPAQQRHRADQLRRLPHSCREPIGAGRRGLPRLPCRRLKAGASALPRRAGMARSALDVAIAYAKDRQSFGTAIFNHQAVGFRSGRVRHPPGSRPAAHLACRRPSDAGRPCLKEAAMAVVCQRNRRGVRAAPPSRRWAATAT